MDVRTCRTLDGRVIKYRTNKRGYRIMKSLPEPIADVREADAARFWAKVDCRQAGECWLWLAASSSSGYGQINIRGRMWPAHRIAFFFANGVLDPNLVVDHTCRNPSCVNPAHLRQVTATANTRSMVGGRGESGVRNVYRRNGGRWYVVVKRGGRGYSGGTFDSFEDACASAARLRAEMFGAEFQERTA